MDSAVADPGFRIGPFTSGDSLVAPTAVSIYRMHPVEVDEWPGWHIRSYLPSQRDSRPLDVLVPVRAPRGGLPAVLHQRETLYFWVDVSIPKGTRNGVYTSAITLTASDVAIGEVAMQLVVWPFVLPDYPSVPMIAELDHRSLFSHHIRAVGRPFRLHVDNWLEDPARRELDTLLASTLRMLRRHGVTPVLPDLAPIARVTAHDSMEVDWRQYDAVIERCMSGPAFLSRPAQQVLPLPPIVLSAGISSRDVESATEQFENLLRMYIKECVRHFREKGWLDRSYAMVPGTEVPGAEAVRKTKQFASIVREVGDGLPILARLFAQDPRDYGWVDFPYAKFDESVDIWMPRAQFFDVETMAFLRRTGNRAWFAIDRPPFSGSASIHAPASSTRVVAWQARELEAEASFLGPVNRWPRAEQAPTPTDCVRFDPNVLLYPGGPFGLAEPVASVRLKHLRRGMQDAAYGELLESRGLGHLARAVRHSITPYQGTAAYRTHFADGRASGWAGETSTYESARRIMAMELIRSATAHASENPAESFPRSAAWRRFMRKTRQLRIQVDGSRVRPAGTRAKPEFEVETAVTIHNGARIPLTGTIGFADLPVGWVTGEPRRISPIPAGGSSRVKLHAVATDMQLRTAEYVELPIEVATDDGVVHSVSAGVSCVTALPTLGSIQIDGDLSDWPVGRSNVCSNFTLICGSGPPTQVAVQPTPIHRTLSFVLRDDEYLYIAVNCESDSRLTSPRSRRKEVRYDDMIPLGEELIEILIDPLNAGTRSPSDLYHIVVKYDGGDLVEQGIRFDPPCGSRRHWPVDIEVATQVSSGRWTAEVRVPLRAFGDVPADHAVWGFNITRFDVVNQEFSTWSKAVRNAYDPASLGNLLLP